MTRPVVFLVNGGAGSAADIRARRVAGALAERDVATRVVTRRGGRALDVPQFATAAARAALIYAMDLAVVPVVAGALPSLRVPCVVDTGDSPAAYQALFGAARWRGAAARALERVGYGMADTIVVRGPHHRRQLVERGYHAVELVPDGVDLDLFRPIADGALRTELGLDDVLTVGVQASFTWNPAIDGGPGWELVHALGRRPDLPIAAVLIGDGPGIAELQRLATRLGVADRVITVGRQPYDELPRYLGLCDVCLLTQSNEPASWVRTTGKLPCYLATGRYIVASRVGTAASLLPEEMLLDYDGVWDREYPTRLAARLAELVDDPGVRERGLALVALAEPFDYRVVARQAALVVRDLLADR